MPAKITLDQGAFEQSSASINKVVSMIITLIIIVVVVMVIYKIYKSIQTGAEIAGKTLGDVYVQNQTGIPVERIAYLRKLAEDCDAAVTYWFGWFGVNVAFSVDEDVIVNAVNQLTSQQEGALFSSAFKAIRGNTLRRDVIESSAFGWGEKDRIDSKKLNWID